MSKESRNIGMIKRFSTKQTTTKKLKIMKTKIQNAYAVGDIVKSRLNGHRGRVVSIDEKTEQTTIEHEGGRDKSHMSWYVLEPDLSIDELAQRYADTIREHTENNTRYLATMVRENWGRLECKVCHCPGDNPAPYYVAWQSDPDPFFNRGGSENNQTLEQAARHMAYFVYYTRRGYSLPDIWKASETA